MAAVKLKDQYFAWAGILIAGLLILGLTLNAKAGSLKKKNLKNKAALAQGLTGFEGQSIEQLRQEIKNLKTRIMNLSVIFDPKDRWFKKDYDLSIYFVEELGKLNQSLKTKALEKKVDFQELGFKEKLPSESEAFFLLSQLSGIKEIVNLGLDYSINFKSVTPQEIEVLEGAPEIRNAKTRIGLTCPAQGLIEFLIQLNEIIPKPYVESFVLKSLDSAFEMTLSMDNTIIDLNWLDKEQFAIPSGEIKKAILSQDEEKFARALRGANPFLTVTPVPKGEVEEVRSVAKSEKPKIQQRFFYHGRATLKSKEVAVIEDTLNEETIFLAQGESIGNFVLKEILSDQIVLENILDKKEIVIKQAEEAGE